jgi:ppGpp synthetase/RelA/SpoT-type nucleotidyltranferase
MSDKNVKTIRKQIRNICQEFLPEILTNELVYKLNKEITETVIARMDSLKERVEKQLEEMNNRSKDMQAYVVNQMGTAKSSSINENASLSDTDVIK